MQEASGKTSVLLRSRLRGAKGFTVLEMVFGLMMLTLLMGALSALMYAAAAGWRATGAGAGSQQAGQATPWIGHIVQRVKHAGHVEPGSLKSTGTAAAVIFWAHDDFEHGEVSANDRRMQVGELLVLEHNRPERAIDMYVPRPVSEMTEEERDIAAVEVKASDLSDSTTLLWFKDQSFVERRRLETGIAGAAFVFHPGGGRSKRPSLEFALKYDEEKGAAVRYGTATMRAAMRPEETDE